MPVEIDLSLYPSVIYRRWAAATTERPPQGAVVLFRRPLLVCLVLGVSVALGATGRVSSGLVLSAAAVWSFVPAVQLAAFAVTTRLFTGRAPAGARSVDLFFMGHLPWSLWLIALSSAAALTFPNGVAGWPRALVMAATISIVVPVAATARIVRAYFGEITGLPPRRARAATALYEGLVWGFAIAFASWAVQAGPRFFGA
jgi:hypothetical protein